MYKKVWCSSAKLLFCLLILLFFFTFSLPSCCWILKTLLSRKNTYRLQLKKLITLYKIMTNFYQYLLHAISWDEQKKNIWVWENESRGLGKDMGEGLPSFPYPFWFFFCPEHATTLVTIVLVIITLLATTTCERQIWINPFAPEPPVTASVDPGPFYPL